MLILVIFTFLPLIVMFVMIKLLGKRLLNSGKKSDTTLFALISFAVYAAIAVLLLQAAS